MSRAKFASGPLLRGLPIALAFVLIVSLAVVQGRLSYRWADARTQSMPMAERLAELPHKFDEWVGEDTESNPRELEAAGAVGHISRTYRNTRTGQQVSVFIVTGHSRDISVHTPDRCYPAAGFTQLGSPQTHSLAVGDRDAEFFTTTFRKENPEGVQLLRVFWSWGHDREWSAPKHPRLAFPNIPGLYKMYLVSIVRENGESPQQSACNDFGRLLLPQLNQLLFNVSEPSSGVTAQDDSNATGASDKDAVASSPAAGTLPATETSPTAAE